MLTGTTQKNNLALSTKAAYPVTQQFHISSYSQEKYVLMGALPKRYQNVHSCVCFNSSQVEITQKTIKNRIN